MTDLAPCEVLPKGEIPGTRQSISFYAGKVPLSPVCDSRDRTREMEDRFATMAERTISEWKDIVTGNVAMLMRLTDKTTNAGRVKAFTSGDARGIHGYLRHAGLDHFPDELIDMTLITNASIKRVLRAVS